jgi:hypothetical protein
MARVCEWVRSTGGDSGMAAGFDLWGRVAIYGGYAAGQHASEAEAPDR